MNRSWPLTAVRPPFHLPQDAHLDVVGRSDIRPNGQRLQVFWKSRRSFDRSFCVPQTRLTTSVSNGIFHYDLATMSNRNRRPMSPLFSCQFKFSFCLGRGHKINLMPCLRECKRAETAVVVVLFISNTQRLYFLSLVTILCWVIRSGSFRLDQGARWNSSGNISEIPSSQSPAVIQSVMRHTAVLISVPYLDSLLVTDNRHMSQQRRPTHSIRLSF